MKAIFRNAAIGTAATLAGALLACAPATAQTIKVGFITTYSGSMSTLGESMDRGARLYMKLNADKLPPGVKIDFITRDDGGPNPDKGKQLAQELIVRDHVQFLGGVVWTPSAAAIAPLVTEAKVPFVIMNAGGSVITTLSPYIVRSSFTLWQSAYPMGQWSAKKYKRAYIAVSDYAPGHDSEAAFEKGFTAAGGEIVGKVRMPVGNPDFVPFMQRAKDAKPDIVFGFIPGGPQSTQIMKAFGDLGLAKAGIRFVGTGDIVSDEELPNMGEAPLGVVSSHHYSTAGDRPANKAFLAAWEKEYGPKSIPNFLAVASYDGMDMIYTAIREQAGKVDADRTIAILKNYKNPNSPRGPIAIDPETRDIVQNEYIRETRKVNGKMANIEIDTIPMAKDYWKEFNNRK
jgi:branched-chain amino acid transport system substrate-binding protein